MCFSVLATNAQVLYTQNFEDAGALATMTTHATDGAVVATNATLNATGLEGSTFWVVGDESGSNAAMTTTWFATAAPADNYLITPAIAIPSGITAKLKWKARSLGSSGYLDPYAVKISSTGTAKADFTTTVFTNDTGAPNGAAGETIEIVIPAEFAGSTIHVGFIATGNDDYIIAFDDILVEEIPASDIALNSFNTATVVEAGMIDITGTVENRGATPITSFDVDWNDGTAHSSTITCPSLAFGETYNFVHPIQLSGEEGTTYTINTCATVPGDANADNNCIEGRTVSAADEVPVKYVVGEEKTGTWCGWCPRGAVALEGMESEDKFIGIAVHNGDPMTVASYDSGIGTYIPGGYPGAGADRIYNGDPSLFPVMYSLRSTMTPPASVSVAYEKDGSNVNVTVTAKFAAAMSGDYRLAAVITEDGVTGTGDGYNQANYYAGGGSGAMGGYETKPNPVPAADMVYDHVARAIGNDQIVGDAGSLPATIAYGAEESYTYTIPFSADWDMNNLHFIGMLVKGSTGEIINAGSVKGELDDSGIEEVVSNFNVTVFPNPASDISNIQLELMETANVTVEIYNTVGKLVFSNSTQNLTQGQYNYSIDVSDFSSGIYSVRTIVNSSVKTTKLSVN